MGTQRTNQRDSEALAKIRAGVAVTRQDCAGLLQLAVARNRADLSYALSDALRALTYAFRTLEDDSDPRAQCHSGSADQSVE